MRMGSRKLLLAVGTHSCCCDLQDWQGPALDALAVWLTEDPARIEPRLTQRIPVERFVRLFARYSDRGGSDELARLLDPFLRILRRSPQITVRLSSLKLRIGLGTDCI